MCDDSERILRNKDVRGVVVEIPEGHSHLRTTITLTDGTTLTFQEATISALLRSFVTVKTHPKVKRVALTGREVEGQKEGFADYQLLEEE